jgi:AcrR family transcriptional regulator
MIVRLPVEERREQLIDAALVIAAGEGISAITIRRVAEQAGVALGVVHYCFQDKDELFTALAARIVDDLVKATAAGLSFDEAPDLETALRAGLSGLWDGITSSRGAQLLTYEITTHSLRHPELRAVAMRQYEVGQAGAEALLDLAAQASGATWTRPVPELAAEALSFIDGTTLRWLVDGDLAAARSRLDTFCGYLAAQAKPARRRRGKS